MKKVVPIVFLTAIFLVACGSSGQDASPVDQQLYNQALQSNNPDLCKPIENSALNKECQEAIEGNKISFEALENTDLQACGKINNKQIKESCNIQVAAKIEEQKKFENLIDDRQKFNMEAINEHNPKICEKINDNNFQQECVLNVIADDSYTDKSKLVCDMFTNEDLKQACLNNPKFN